MKMLDEVWFQTFNFLGLASIALSVFFVLVYYIRLFGLNSRTEKYRFATQNESKVLRKSSNLLAFGIGFFSFVLISRAVGLVDGYTYIFIGFFAFLIGLSIGYGLWAYLKYYYPFILEKRLHKIRFSPMKSPHHGRPMRLLNENEEDTHLTQQMIDDEGTHTVDYDVWIDEVNQHKVIEKYDTHFHALVCENCNYRTMKEKNEEVVESPTQYKEGLLLKHYECTYCGHHLHKEVVLPSYEEESQLEKTALKHV